MKWAIIYLVIVYLIACADDVGDGQTVEQRIVRAFFWPITLTSFFRSQSIRLHRLLTILWTCTVGGWFVTLLIDRL